MLSFSYIQMNQESDLVYDLLLLIANLLQSPPLLRLLRQVLDVRKSAHIVLPHVMLLLVVDPIPVIVLVPTLALVPILVLAVLLLKLSMLIIILMIENN